MRIALVAAALVVFAFASDRTAQAQNYPWCAQYSEDMGGSMNCGFVSFNQCMSTVQGMGGFCIVNNRYVPPSGPAPSHKANKRNVRTPS